MTLTVLVPANLLLMGEYAILEEGGLGLAIAPDIRVTGTAILPDTRGSGPPPVGTITGTMPGQMVRWPGDTGFLGRVASHLEEALGPLSAAITLDSRSLFTTRGEKRGLGSSAATVVALTALWMRTATAGNGRQPAPPDPAALFRTALQAHRTAQDGAGSGYDVACSTFGGMTRFTGGSSPAAKSVDLPWLPGARLIAGASPVRTTSAVKLYARWKEEHPAEARTFLERSNGCVSAFLSARTWPEAAGILTDYANLAAQLGDSISVPALLEHNTCQPHGKSTGNQPAVSKAIGAGNELGIVLGNGSLPPGEEIRVSPGGVTWV